MNRQRYHSVKTIRKLSACCSVTMTTIVCGYTVVWETYGTWVCCDCQAIISCVKAWHAWIISSLVLYCMAMTGVGPCRYGSRRASFRAGADELDSSPSRSPYSIFSRIFAWNQHKITPSLNDVLRTVLLFSYAVQTMLAGLALTLSLPSSCS